MSSPLPRAKQNIFYPKQRRKAMIDPTTIFASKLKMVKICQSPNATPARAYFAHTLPARGHSVWHLCRIKCAIDNPCSPNESHIPKTAQRFTVTLAIMGLRLLEVL